MNDMTQINQDPQNLIRNAWRVAWALLGAGILTFFVYGIVAIQLGVWQIMAAAGSIGVYVMINVVSLYLLRQGHKDLAVILIMGGISLVMPFVSSLLTGVGIALGIGLILLNLLIAGLTLAPKYITPVIFISLFFGMLTIFIDVMNVSPMERLLIPEIRLFAPFIVVASVLALGIFIVRQFKNYNLRTKFMLIFLSVSVLSFSIVLGFANWRANTLLKQQIGEDLFSLATAQGKEIGNILQTQVRILEALSLNDATNIALSTRNISYPQDAEEIQTKLNEVADFWGRTQDKEALKSSLFNIFLSAELQDFTSVFPTHLDLLVTDKYGGVVGASGIPPQYIYDGEVWWQAAYNNGLGAIYIDEPVFDPVSKKHGVVIAVPVYNADKVIGIIRSIYSIDDLLTVLKSVSIDETQADLFFDVNEEAPFGEKKLSLIDGTPVKIEASTHQALLDNDAKLLEDNYAELIFEREPSLVSLAPVETLSGGEVIDKLGWQAVVHQDSDQALSPVDALVTSSIAVAMGVTLLVILGALMLSKTLSGPIERLTQTAQAISQGQLDVRANVESRDETGQLAFAFNTMADQLQNSIRVLETQVKERTADVLASLEVGQQASTIRNVDELLPTITEFIRDRFNLYYTQIYLIDEERTSLQLHSGTGKVGQELLAAHHHLPLDGISLVATAARNAEYVFVADTEDSDIHQPNPLLPRTRSELAIPLILEDTVIGVLDMQSDHPETFNLDNLPVFAAMATQLASALDSARLLAAAQEAQKRTEQVVRRFVQQSWTDHLRTAHGDTLSLAYDLQAVKAVKQAENGQSHSGEAQQLAVPLQVQNQTIGRLSVQAPNRTWSDNEKALLNAVAEKLSQKTENLRLFEQTQKRAAREQLVREITDKIRASADIEAALKTAATELSQALGVPKASIDLRVTGNVEEVDLEEQV
jgi:GAF domain-containing protein/HAMP domain-containing protein